LHTTEKSFLKVTIKDNFIERALLIAKETLQA
jgi:hypothetical protein